VTQSRHKPLWTYAGRFVLPLVLLAGAVATSIVADRLEEVDRAPSVTSSGESAELPLASVRRIPGFAVAAAETIAVDTTLAALPEDPGGSSCATVLVDGVPVVQLRDDRPLVPSFAQLLVTGHAAIELLGPDFRYTTQLLAQDLPDANGEIYAGLYFDGGGDPVLRSYEYSIGFRPVRSTRTPLEDLATAAVEAGLLQVDGDIIAIERRYDDQRVLPGAFADDGSTAIGPLTAAQVDDGFEQRAAANLGVAVPSETPAALAAQRVGDELADAGVLVFGTGRTLGDDEELPTLVLIASLDSPPLADIVFQTLAVNDATAAEMIMKELGVAAEGEGSTQAGGRAVQRVLQDQGVELSAPFRDGSGLDPFGGTTCAQLAAAADTIPDDHPTLEILPTYDLPGVYDGRFADLEIASDLRLVGGVSGDNAGLVARTVDADGQRVTVAAIANRPGGPTEEQLAYQQSLVELVDDLRSGTTLDTTALDD